MSGDVMLYTIKYNIDKEYIVEKSKFFVKLYKIASEDDVNKILIDIKNKYKGASHYCYGYIINNIKRFNDDKEPNGTAGLPILDVLIKNNINYVLAVVIRYFGGIKLGASRLSRTYSMVIRKSINKDDIVNLIASKKVKVIFKYDDIKKVDYILKDINIYYKEYNNDIIYYCNIDINSFNNIILELNLIDNINIEYLEDSYIEKNK
jgi:uncharacterized YigZ family protein